MHCILSALVFNVEDLTHHYSTVEGAHLLAVELIQRRQRVHSLSPLTLCVGQDLWMDLREREGESERGRAREDHGA